jgi:DNA-nicking Smr family endonuclease
MSDKNKVSSEDKALFRQAVKDVRRLDNKGQHYNQKKLPRIPSPTKSPPSDTSAHPELIETENYLRVDTDTPLFFARPGVQAKVLRRLRQGKVAISAEIDLHGLNKAEAKQTLLALITHSQTQAYRCIRIIHGKSRRQGEYPVLKNALNQWLPQLPAVLAYCSARPEHGGAGALYVLLKKV